MDPKDFRERWPWIGGDLQTLRNFLQPGQVSLAAWPAERLEIAFADGDRTLVTLHAGERLRRGAGLVLLVHGLTGCEDSAYLRASAQAVLKAGYAAARVNLRGAGPARRLCRGHYNAGRSSDLAEIIRGLVKALPRAKEAPLFVMGFSLGGNLLLKFLGERWEAGWPVTGAVSISAPILLKASQERLMAPRNRIYHNYLLGRMKAETPGVTEKQRRAIKTVWQFDNEIVGPAAGYAGAEDYYAGASSAHLLKEIEVPALMIHARNDPWIPAAAYEEGGWRGNNALEVALTPGGGHVGFHGQGSQTAWHDRAALAFFSKQRI